MLRFYFDEVKMASCRKDSAIMFRSTIYVRPSFDAFGHTNISTMRETFRIGKLGFSVGTFLFLKSSIILLAFFFYFSICFHVSTSNLIMAIILFEKKMPCISWCQPFNLGTHHYFDFKGHAWELSRVFGGEFWWCGHDVIDNFEFPCNSVKNYSLKLH